MQRDTVEINVINAIVAKFIEKYLFNLGYQSSRIYKSEDSGKNNGKTTDQNRKGNNEKWKNLYLIVIHSYKAFKNVNKFTNQNRKIKQQKTSNNRPSTNN